MRAPLICLSALALALSGCGSSNSEPSGTDPSPASPDGGSPTAPGVPDGSGSPTDDGTALIDADSYEAILRQVVTVANDEPLDAAAAGLTPLFETVDGLVHDAFANGAASGDGLSFVSREDGTGGPDRSTFTFSCDGGGTLAALTYVYDDLDFSPLLDTITASGTCLVGGDGYDGRAYRLYRIVRTPTEESYAMSVVRADGSSLTLDGDYTDDRTEGMYSVAHGWTDASLVTDDGSSTTRIDGYTSSRTDVPDFGPATPLYQVDLPEGGTASVYGTGGAPTAKVAFSVTAPWTSGERLDVSVDLASTTTSYRLAEAEADGSYRPLSDLGSPLVLTNADTGEQITIDNLPASSAEPAQWQSGSLTITAADGSSLVLSPETGDPATFSVTIRGVPDPIVREWADGFQVACPREDCGSSPASASGL